jgi:hypothetical protein
MSNAMPLNSSRRSQSISFQSSDRLISFSLKRSYRAASIKRDSSDRFALKSASRGQLPCEICTKLIDEDQFQQHQVKRSKFLLPCFSISLCHRSISDEMTGKCSTSERDTTTVRCCSVANSLFCRLSLPRTK